MSTADVASQPQGDKAARAASDRPGCRAGPGSVGLASVGPWLRLLRSELGLVFLRRRNLALLAVLAAIPVILGIVLRVSSPQTGGRGDGPAFLGQVTGSGVFLAFLALGVALTLILPVASRVGAGDAIAGQLGRGARRRVPAIPPGPTRPSG